MMNKILYRRELPCPHCGFDPTWYKKDIKLARRKIAEFFEKQAPTEKREVEEVMEESQRTPPEMNP